MRERSKQLIVFSDCVYYSVVIIHDCSRQQTNNAIALFALRSACREAKKREGSNAAPARLFQNECAIPKVTWCLEQQPRRQVSPPLVPYIAQ